MSDSVTIDFTTEYPTDSFSDVPASATVHIKVADVVSGITQSLSTGNSVSAAVDDWIKRAESAVNFYKKQPNQCSLSLYSGLDIDDSVLPKELSKLVADLAFKQSAKAKSIQAWLEACANNYNGGEKAPSDVSLDKIVDTFKRVSEASQSLKQENELLLLQMQQVQEELEASFIKGKELEKELVALKEEQRKRDSEKKKSQKSQQEFQEENELLLLQLQQVQEELEKTFIDKQTLQKELTEITSQLEQVKTAKNEVSQRLEQRDNGVETLERELAAAQAEKAQAEQAQEVPAKRSVEDNKDVNELEDLTEENELLLLQLQQVQEELEHYFIKCKELEAGGASTSQSAATTYTQPNIAAPKQPDVTDSPAWRVVAPFYTKLDKLIRHLIFKRQAKVVKKSKLFDKKWYAETYQDVKGFKGGAALHYVAHGAAEGRDPGPEFSTERYWAMNPDVAEKGTNPLVHYELFGKNEGRYY